MARPTHVCTQCGYVGKPSMEASTNGCFAIVLLLCFVIPAILYIIFAARSRPICPKCRKVQLTIPLDTPQARLLTERAHSEVTLSRTRDEGCVSLLCGADLGSGQGLQALSSRCSPIALDRPSGAHADLRYAIVMNLAQGRDGRRRRRHADERVLMEDRRR
jgi:hypothetical protein